ncbi:MAG: site-2 protease family protein [Chloroflexi bacterium]|nr:site-2 protease family protein [Chloroflexota bacterium]
MFWKSFKLFKLFGFEVKMDLSWLVIGALVAWSLADGLFPFYFKNLSSTTYWIMGVVGAVGLFVSIVFHELCHSLVARRFGMPMKGITLFIFGGVSEMVDEPPSAKAEFSMAIVGPASSLVLGGLFYAFNYLGRSAGWIVPVTAVLAYLGLVNVLLAGFNLLPAFPLDGGRVLRAGLWRWKKNLLSSTRIASSIGSVFGVVLIVVGVVYVLLGQFVNGVWWFMIGIFLRSAAQSSYQQVLLRQGLQGLTVRRFMQPDVVTVAPSTSVDRLVDDYIYKYHFKMYPVVQGDRLLGCVTTKQLQDVPRNEWSARSVQQLSTSCSPDNTISPEASAMEALAKMSRTRNSRLMVVQDSKLLGIVAIKDMLDYLSIKTEVEGRS